MKAVALVATVSAVLSPASAARAQCTFPANATVSYAPPEVPEAHPNHKLTIFLPLVPPPADTNLYPTVLYSPASGFASAAESTTLVATVEQGFSAAEPLTTIEATVGPAPPAGSSSFDSPSEAGPCGFLSTALQSGWAVVTVGTTGWDSWPTCSQLNDCNDCQNPPADDPMCAPTASCWDTNLWYAPTTAQWNDFNLFWGEKELTWARQWVGQSGAAMMLDTDRVVVCGTSSGAMYASFLAYGPNRAWGSTYSAQAQQDTRVAGIVSFEPNTWLRALKSTWGGVHWPSSTNPMTLCGPTGQPCVFGNPADCYNRRSTTLSGSVGDVADGLLEESSTSRFIRVLETGELPTPSFIAAGDGFFTTGFARDANLPPHVADYQRYMSPGAMCGSSTSGSNLIAGDPVLTYTLPPNDLRIHDSWYAMNFAVDLQMLDSSTGVAFHENRSRLFLQTGHMWAWMPTCLSKTANPPMSESDVLFLDGTFANLGILQSIDNQDLAPKVVDWMDAELCVPREVGVLCRNPVVAGAAAVPNPNYSIFRSDCAVVNTNVDIEVDLNPAPGYDQASIAVCFLPYGPGSELVLSAGQVLLVDIAAFMFTTPFTSPDPDGVVRTSLPGANLAGLTFYTQAILLDLQAQMPFALTNSQDITIQASCP